MKNEFLVFRKIDEPLSFRIIDNPTNEWIDVKIHELTLNNFQVKIHCIASGDDMLINRAGRKIYSKTKLDLLNWKQITETEAFWKCINCDKVICSIDCINTSLILMLKN